MKFSDQIVSLTPFNVCGRNAAAELVGQFFLSKRPPSIQWNTFSLGEWNLSVETRLPCTQVRSGANTIGWLLGHAVSSDGRMVAGEFHLPADRIEETIYSLGGRFIVILPLLQRVYLDPCGLLSAVYCAHAEIVASSPSLVPYDDLTEDRTDLNESIGIPFKNAMYPLGMTPRNQVERILPNHFLDLDSWQSVRHWPTKVSRPVDSVPDAVAEIAAIVKQQIRAIVKHGPATLRLTAGKDSRMLLACARDVVSELECVTADFHDSTSRIDSATAKKLARIANVHHRSLQWIDPDEHDLELWLFRAGFGTGEFRGWTGTTMFRLQLDPLRCDIVGLVGEVARGFYWRRGDTPTMEISAARLLQHCHCPETPETLARADAWISEAATGDSFHLLDLFYVEQRLGCWAGVWAYAEAPNCLYQAFPLCHRRVVDLMMRLPVEYRRSGTLPNDIISREWPELLAQPFNTPTLLHRVAQKGSYLLSKISRAARDPHWALSRILRR